MGRGLPRCGAVRRAFDAPDVAAVHGTAWTLVVADLTGRPPDLAWWAGLAMPDVIAVGG